MSKYDELCKAIFDTDVQNPDVDPKHGAEPSLRCMIHHYYVSHGIQSGKALHLSQQLIDGLMDTIKKAL